MHYPTPSPLPRFLRTLVLIGGMASAIFSLQACIGDPGSAGDQKEQARVKDKAPDDTDGRVCIAVVVCGADGKLYGTPCDADAAKVKYSYDLGQCGERRDVTIDPILRCGNDSIPDVSIDPIIPPGIDEPVVILPVDPIVAPPGGTDDPEVCAAVMVCDDDGKQCHSLCDKTR